MELLGNSAVARLQKPYNQADNKLSKHFGARRVRDESVVEVLWGSYNAI